MKQFVNIKKKFKLKKNLVHTVTCTTVSNILPGYSVIM